MGEETKPANDNPKTTTISLTDLAVGLGLDEDALIERIGDIMLSREDPNDDP